MLQETVLNVAPLPNTGENATQSALTGVCVCVCGFQSTVPSHCPIVYGGEHSLAATVARCRTGMQVNPFPWVCVCGYVCVHTHSELKLLAR